MRLNIVESIHTHIRVHAKLMIKKNTNKMHNQQLTWPEEQPQEEEEKGAEDMATFFDKL
jgi:hypothetical protein